MKISIVNEIPSGLLFMSVSETLMRPAVHSLACALESTGEFHSSWRPGSPRPDQLAGPLLSDYRAKLPFRVSRDPGVAADGGLAAVCTGSEGL